MKHVAKLFSQLASAALFAVALTGCGRGEYAMLPKTSPYHETHTAVRTVPAPQPVAAEATTAPTETAAVTPAPATAAPAPAAASKAAPTAQPQAVAAAKPAHKSNLMERALVKKMMHKAEKMTAKAQIKQHRNAASADQVQAQSHLRLGIILLAIGLILALFTGVNGIFGVLGTIAIIIGIVLLVLWLLEQV